MLSSLLDRMLLYMYIERLGYESQLNLKFVFSLFSLCTLVANIVASEVYTTGAIV